MMPKIGLKTLNIFYEGEGKIDFNVLEIITKDPNLIFNTGKILKAKEHLKGKDLSMHSQTSRVFSCNNLGFKEFNEAELYVLKAEIILCGILGIKELIFHLKQEILNKDEEKILEDIFDFSKKRDVELIYESNDKFYGETTLYVLKRFPDLNYNLDLGHLNTAVGIKTLGMEINEFISKVKDRIVYIHAHNNNGKNDEHKTLDDGTLDWRNVLDMLNLSKVRKIIIEVKTKEDIYKNKNLLESYLKN